MRAIVRDYSRPGDTVCDPTAGWGTTLRAAQETGRLWLGSEMDPHAHAVATKRLAQPYTPPLFDDARPAQTGIFDEVEG
jgi:DNA modification methylase